MENKIKNIIIINENKINVLNNEINEKINELKNIINNENIYDIITFANSKINKINDLNNELNNLKNENDKLYYILNDTF